MTCYDSMRLAGHGVGRSNAAPPEMCTSQVSVARQRAAVDRNSVNQGVQFTHFLHFGRKCLWRQGFLESSHFSVDNFVDIPLVGRASPCAVVLWSLCLPKRHCLCRLMNQPLTLMPWIGCHFARMRPGEPAAVPAGPSVCISGAARATSRLNAGAARANSCARLRPARSHARAG